VQIRRETEKLLTTEHDELLQISWKRVW